MDRTLLGIPSPVASLKLPRRDGKEDGNAPAGRRENVNREKGERDRERKREGKREKDNAPIN